MCLCGDAVDSRTSLLTRAWRAVSTGLSANAQKLIAVNQEVQELRQQLQQKDAELAQMKSRLEQLGENV